MIVGGGRWGAHVSEVGPVEGAHQHSRGVGLPPEPKIGRKWVRLQSPELPMGPLCAESSTFMVVGGVPSPLEPKKGPEKEQ